MLFTPRSLRLGFLSVGLAVTGVAAARELAYSAPRLAGTDSVQPARYVATVAPGQTACQPATIPPGTAAVRVFEGTYSHPGPALKVTLLDRTRELSDTSVPQGYPSAFLVVPVPIVRSEVYDGAVCLRNIGPTPLALAGTVGSAMATVSNAPVGAALTIDFFRAGSESWLALTPTIAGRLAVAGDSFHGEWSLWIVGALTAAMWVIAVAIVLKSPTKAPSPPPRGHSDGAG